MKFPAGMRPASLEERQEFYESEFNARKAAKWVKSFVAIDTGRNSGIIKPGLESVFLILKPFGPAELSEKMLQYLPEDVYYDRNIYKDPWKCMDCPYRFSRIKAKFCWWVCPFDNFVGQELAFDIDPENMSPVERDSVYSFTKKEFEAARLATMELLEYTKQFSFKPEVIYSGRGFHITVKNKGLDWTLEKRQEFLNALPEKFQIPIDPWVTRGNIRFLRLPFSLHGLVSRVVTPIKPSDLESTDLLDRFKPMYL